MKNLTFSFFILFIILVSGCVSQTDNKQEEVVNPSVFSANMSFSKALDKGQIILNPGEQIVANVLFKNEGTFPARNVQAVLYGCDIGIFSTGQTTSVWGGKDADILNPKESRVLSWQIVAPENFSGECVLSSRLCFNYTTEGYKSIDISQQGAVGGRGVTYSSAGPIEITFDFSDNYIIFTDYSSITFNFKFKNVGKGQLQYPGNSEKTSYLNKINLTIVDPTLTLLGGDLSQWVDVKYPSVSNSPKDAFYKDRFEVIEVTFGSNPNLYRIYNKNVYTEYESDIIADAAKGEDKEIKFGFYSINLNPGAGSWNLHNSYDLSPPQGEIFPGKGELRFTNNELTKKATFYVNKSRVPETGSKTVDVRTELSYTYCISGGSVRVKAAR